MERPLQQETDLTIREMQRKIVHEQKWLMWLLQIWDVNERKPNWVTVKRRWPKEYKLILTEVGPWSTVDQKLETAYKIREEEIEGAVISQLQKSRALDPRRKYSLEEHIVGLIRLMDYLGIERLPTLKEIAKYAAKLGIPAKTSYERQLVTKDNWYPCIQGYLAASPGERGEVLRKMEIELARQRDARWKRDKMFQEKNSQRAEYTRSRCLDDLSRIYDHFACIPTRVKIDAYAKEKDLACYGTLLRHLGPMKDWGILLARHRAQKEIQRYIATYNNLEMDTSTECDSLLDKILRIVTPGEKLKLENLAERMRKATRKKPVKCEICLDGREYEIVIRPKK